MTNNPMLSKIMTTDLLTLSPTDNFKRVNDIFTTRELRHLPVIDETGKIVGIISKTDYLSMSDGLSPFRSEDERETDLNFLHSLSAKEVMGKELIKLGPEDKANLAANIFQQNLFHAIPIVGENDKLLGIVTTIDLIKYAYNQET